MSHRSGAAASVRAGVLSIVYSTRHRANHLGTTPIPCAASQKIASENKADDGGLAVQLLLYALHDGSSRVEPELRAEMRHGPANNSRNRPCRKVGKKAHGGEAQRIRG